MVLIVYEWVYFVFSEVVCVVVELFLICVNVVCEVVRPILLWVVVVCMVVWPILLSVIVYRGILFIVSFIWKVFFPGGGLVLGCFGQFVCIRYFEALIFLLYVVVCVWGLYLQLVHCVFGLFACLSSFFCCCFFYFPFVCVFSFSFSFSFPLLFFAGVGFLAM